MKTGKPVRLPATHTKETAFEMNFEWAGFQ